VGIKTCTDFFKKERQRKLGTGRVTISALPQTRHLPVHDFLPSSTEYTKALELHERCESSPQLRDVIFEEFSPSFVNLLACWCKNYCLLILAIIGKYFISPILYH